MLRKPIEEPIYLESEYELRWSRFKNMDPEVMHRMFTKENGVSLTKGNQGLNKIMQWRESLRNTSR